jgi:protein-disulfide isomerase
MNVSNTQATFDALVWGQGSKTLEVFLEPTCPFSAKAFAKLDALMEKATPQCLTLKIRLLSQPWHLLSPTVTRAILAASATQAGKSAAKAVMAAVFANREAFILVNHCSGPNQNLSVHDILGLIEQHSGVPVKEAFELPELMVEMKWQARYARQNGIHATPTFMVDGLVVAEMSSGDAVEVWLEKLGLA